MACRVYCLNLFRSVELRLQYSFHRPEALHVLKRLSILHRIAATLELPLNSAWPRTSSTHTLTDGLRRKGISGTNMWYKTLHVRDALPYGSSSTLKYILGLRLPGGLPTRCINWLSFVIIRVKRTHPVYILVWNFDVAGLAMNAAVDHVNMIPCRL